MSSLRTMHPLMLSARLCVNPLFMPFASLGTKRWINTKIQLSYLSTNVTDFDFFHLLCSVFRLSSFFFFFILIFLLLCCLGLPELSHLSDKPSLERHVCQQSETSKLCQTLFQSVTHFIVCLIVLQGSRCAIFRRGLLYSYSLVSAEESCLYDGQYSAAMPRKLAKKCCDTCLPLKGRECVLVT